MAMDSEIRERRFFRWLDSAISNATAVWEERSTHRPSGNEVVATGPVQSNGYSRAKPISYSPWRNGRITKLAHAAIEQLRPQEGFASIDRFLMA